MGTGQCNGTAQGARVSGGVHRGGNGSELEGNAGGGRERKGHSTGGSSREQSGWEGVRGSTPTG